MEIVEMYSSALSSSTCFSLSVQRKAQTFYIIINNSTVVTSRELIKSEFKIKYLVLKFEIYSRGHHLQFIWENIFMGKYVM